MASSADNSTALKLMTEVNSDFLEFINNLRDFLTGKEPVTFNIGGGITVNSLLNLISDYRNGKFDTLVLGDQSTGTQVELSVVTKVIGDKEVLCLSVRDANNPTEQVYIECDRLTASKLDSCEAQTISVENARIGSITGSTSVRGGVVTLDALNVSVLGATVVNSSSMNVHNLFVDNYIQSNKMTLLGARQFVPKLVRNVFYRNDSPLDDASTYLHISDSVWNMEGEGYLTPYDLGFAEEPSRVSPIAVPDLVHIMGDNQYDDYKKTTLFVSTDLNIPSNIIALAETNHEGHWNQYPFEESVNYAFASAIMWPTGFMSTLADGTTGALYLTGFSSSDIGKEIYYRTGSTPWSIYRSLRVTHGASGSTVYFGNPYEIPAYSCVRFIVGRHDSYPWNTQDARTIDYTLELA